MTERARRRGVRALLPFAALGAVLAFGAGAACAPRSAAEGQAASAATAPIPTAAARVLARYPHDADAFTQGLLVRDGKLFESTGGYGQSTIREVDLATGRVRRQVRLPANQFGEGLTDWGSELVSITWQNGVGHRWRIVDFAALGDFRYDGEGWGLARGASEVVLSDGSPVLRFLDPKTLKVVRRVTVTADGRPLAMLNELEWVEGELLANVWHDERIARIDPASGRVKGWIDLSDIVRTTPKRDGESVPNGIAWDRQARRLYITGKNWPTLYRIAWPID